MPIWASSFNDLYWSYQHGSFTDEEWDGFVADLTRLIKDKPGGGVLTIVYSSEVPSPTQRKALAAAVSDAPSTFKHAFVTDSRFSRGVLTALDWLMKKPYQERYFALPMEGINWLASELGENPDYVRTEIVAAVPQESLWSALIQS